MPGASENDSVIHLGMFNSWRAKWLILNYSVLEFATNFNLTSCCMYRVFYAILFYFVDYGNPLSQIKIVLFILGNHECLIRRRRCINIVFIFTGQWKARVICGVLILENYPWCVLPLRSKYWKRDKLLPYWNKNSNKLYSRCQSMIRNIYT